MLPQLSDSAVLAVKYKALLHQELGFCYGIYLCSRSMSREPGASPGLDDRGVASEFQDRAPNSDS